MADPLERLIALMGGDEAFQEAAANLLPQQPKKTNDGCATKWPNEPKESFVALDSEILKQEQPLQIRKSNQTIDKKLQRDGMCAALRRLQRYLGLRANTRSVEPDALPNTQEPTFGYSRVAGYPFDSDVVFLSVDIEADETNHSHVTEIGIAKLDTRHLKNLPPGPGGKDWMNLVTGRHFRIAERVHIRNSMFVQGNPDGFNDQFGTSEFVPLSNIAALVKECFEIKDTTKTDGSLRNIVLVGHDMRSDVKWLNLIGVDLLSIPNLAEVLTTDTLFKALKREMKLRTRLEVLLAEMDITAWGLHNAGNDAAYTLQALLATAMRALSKDRPVVDLEERLRVARIAAEQKVNEDWDAWTAAEMDSKDGRDPVPYAKSSLRG